MVAVRSEADARLLVSCSSARDVRRTRGAARASAQASPTSRFVVVVVVVVPEEQPDFTRSCIQEAENGRPLPRDITEC